MTTNRSLWRVTLASGPPPILAAPPGAKHPPSNLRGAKKNLIATLPNSEIDSTHWKQSTRQDSNRNKTALFSRGGPPGRNSLLAFSRIAHLDSSITSSGFLIANFSQKSVSVSCRSGRRRHNPKRDARIVLAESTGLLAKPILGGLA